MSRRRNPDIIDRSVGFVQDLNNAIWEVPYDISNKTLETTLDLKDAVKHTIGINPRNPHYVYRYHNGGWNYWMTLDPRRQGEFRKYVRLANSLPTKYRIVTARMNPDDMQCSCHPSNGTAMNRRRNARGRRNPEDGAEAMFESFHGEPSEETVIVEKEIHEHEWVAALGDLVECVIITPLGEEISLTFEEDPPMLCTTEDGTQLYIEGGDQSIDLSMLSMDGEDWVKDRMILGEFAPPGGKRTYNLSYLTRKKFDAFEEIEYQHDLSEPDEGESKSARRAPAMLEYDPNSEQLYVSGGQYVIKRPLIGMSPGIEN